MTTALDIVTRALVTINAIQAGEAPSAQEAADGIVSLNDLLQSLGNEGLTIASVGAESFSLNGSSSYTIGTGGNFNTARPVKVTNAYYTVNSVDYPVRILTMTQYQDISVKSTTGTILDAIAVDYAYPLARVYTWPVISSGTLTMNMEKHVASVAATDVLSLQPGYERMLRYNLAAEMLPEYMSVPAGVAQDIVAKAQQSKSNIKRVNYKPMRLVNDVPTSRYSRGNIKSGW